MLLLIILMMVVFVAGVAVLIVCAFERKRNRPKIITGMTMAMVGGVGLIIATFSFILHP